MASLSLNIDVAIYFDKSTLFKADNNRKNRIFESIDCLSPSYVQFQDLLMFEGNSITTGYGDVLGWDTVKDTLVRG